jgi:UDP-N-acetylmuramate--alanine ligase
MKIGTDVDISEASPAWAGIDLPLAAAAASSPLGRIHFVGIGGIGMSGIAEVLLTLGYRITGSDLGESEITSRLAGLGADIARGHSAESIDSDVDVVVVSSAVDDANPEVRAARRMRIPVIPRAEMLAELMRVKCGIAVAGAHGKTTTTSLVAATMAAAGLDPTVVIGGRLKAFGGTNARLGTSRYMVAEADESDGSFLMLRPTISVVTNIDREHMNYYGTMECLIDAYIEFINGTPFFGRAILCGDDEQIASLLGSVKKRYVTYGTSLEHDFCAADISYVGLGTSFDVLYRGVGLGRAHVAMPGKHAALNALAAIAVGVEFGIPFERSVAALSAFEGIIRRFEHKGDAGGVTVIDDYGHHPTEILATLAAAKNAFDRRIVAVFQPHRYSRTKDLLAEFTRAFGDAELVIVTDIYAAGEDPIDGISGVDLAEAIERQHKGGVVYAAAGDGLAAEIAALVKDGDVVITLGAGDITRLGPRLLEQLDG